jgi:hypothetical protein
MCLSATSALSLRGAYNSIQDPVVHLRSFDFHTQSCTKIADQLLDAGPTAAVEGILASDRPLQFARPHPTGAKRD